MYAAALAYVLYGEVGNCETSYNCYSKQGSNKLPLFLETKNDEVEELKINDRM